ncbi:hypothetical protein QTN25_003345 [Entamoeba marina]
MIKRSEESSGKPIRHPSGNYFDMPKKGSEITNYKGANGTEIQIRIVEDNKFDDEMKRYYDILNGVKPQKCALLEKMKDKIEKRDVVINQPRKIPISRIHWSTIPIKIQTNKEEVSINNPRLGEEREVNGEIVTFIQDDIDFIKFTKTGNPFDRLCVIDLTYCQGNNIDIHTPNGVLFCQSNRGKNGSVFEQECGIGGIENRQYKKATFYVSFVQSYAEDGNKYRFELDHTPSRYTIAKTCQVTIPADYNKDVFYWDYQNRQELFGYSQYNNIPVYFPIPVSKGECYAVFFYVKKSYMCNGQLLHVVVMA